MFTVVCLFAKIQLTQEKEGINFIINFIIKRFFLNVEGGSVIDKFD